MVKDTFKFFKERLLTHFLGMLVSFTVALAAGYIMAVNIDAEIKMKIFEAVRGIIEGAGAIDGDGNISAFLYKDCLNSFEQIFLANAKLQKQLFVRL